MAKDREIKEYTTDIEDLFISFLITNPELYVRCKNIIKPTHFEDNKNKKTISFLEEHYDDYSVLPTEQQIVALVKKEYDKLDDITEKHYDWFLDEFESFCRHKELENVILSSPSLLTEGRYGEVLSKVKDAVSLGLVKDLGTNYFRDPQQRLQDMRDRKKTISTGWADVDERLYGGLNRSEITLYAGQSGAGKSLFLQNQAVNWAEAGLNVLYITLELSEALCAMRLDAMITGYGTREVMKNIDDVATRVMTFNKKYKGTLQIKQLPNGCNANDIRAYVKEYELQSGVKLDAILIDYLDLCMPMSTRVSPSDLFVKDKYVTEELRNLAVELDVIMVSASQLNRSSHEEVEFGHSHISGGISKINTADNVIGIFVTPNMKENGRYQIQFMKTRSSAGVGSKVDLSFNIKSLRISDMSEAEANSMDLSRASNVIDKLKQSDSTKVGDQPSTEPKDEDVMQSAASLRDILKRKK